MSIFIFKNFGILITCSIVMSSGFYFMLYQSMSIKLLIILLTLVGIACSYQTLIIYLACTFVPSNISGIYLPWLFLQIIASGVYVAKKAWSLNKKLIDDKANIVFFKTKQQDTVLSKTLLAHSVTDLVDSVCKQCGQAETVKFAGGRPNGGVNYFAQDGDFDLFYVRDLQSKSGEKAKEPENILTYIAGCTVLTTNQKKQNCAKLQVFHNFLFK